MTKRDQIVAAILDSIVRGEIEPGEPIIESKIGAQLGCGTPLIREALIELEYRGYVRKAPFKGTFVTKLSREEIEQIFELRIELEAIAVEWARRRFVQVWGEVHTEIERLVHERQVAGSAEADADEDPGDIGPVGGVAR